MLGKANLNFYNSLNNKSLEANNLSFKSQEIQHGHSEQDILIKDGQLTNDEIYSLFSLNRKESPLDKGVNTIIKKYEQRPNHEESKAKLKKIKENVKNLKRKWAKTYNAIQDWFEAERSGDQQQGGGPVSANIVAAKIKMTPDGIQPDGGIGSNGNLIFADNQAQANVTELRSKEYPQVCYNARILSEIMDKGDDYTKEQLFEQLTLDTTDAFEETLRKITTSSTENKEQVQREGLKMNLQKGRKIKLSDITEIIVSQNSKYGLISSMFMPENVLYP